VDVLETLLDDVTELDSLVDEVSDEDSEDVSEELEELLTDCDDSLCELDALDRLDELKLELLDELVTELELELLELLSPTPGTEKYTLTSSQHG
jgi:hypothetical protein